MYIIPLAQNINDEMKKKMKFSLYSQVKENFLFILSKVLLDIPSVTLMRFESRVTKYLLDSV